MTMGIVLVACLAARIAGRVAATRTSTLSCTSSATRLGIGPAFPQRSDTQPGCFFPQYNRDLADLAGMPRREARDCRDRLIPTDILSVGLSRLLRVGERTKRKEQSRISSNNENLFFMSFTADLLTLLIAHCFT